MEIWKFNLKVQEEQIIETPENAEILDVQMQDGQPVMWIICDPKAPKIEVKINMHGTGWTIDNNRSNDHYLGTVQQGSIVWHYFMQVD